MISARGKNHAKTIIEKKYSEQADDLKKNLVELREGESVSTPTNFYKRKD